MHDERVRLFVALELPETVRAELIGWRDRAAPRAGDLRHLSPDSLHVTLCFLGWRMAGEVEAIAAGCAVISAQPAPRLSLGDARWLPPRRPRVLAVEIADPAGEVSRIQGMLSAALAAGAWYRPEKRPYLPHVTLARIAHGGRIVRDALPPLSPVEFEPARVTLMRSRLHRSGARYEPLAALELRRR